MAYEFLTSVHLSENYVQREKITKSFTTTLKIIIQLLLIDQDEKV